MSDKPLAEKLMLKPGGSALFVQAPQGYEALLDPLPDDTTVLKKARPGIDVIQVFVDSRRELEQQLPRLKPALAPRGILWVTYHKGTSGIKTDINRDSIAQYARSIGLQAVATISVDEDWSALRLKSV